MHMYINVTIRFHLNDLVHRLSYFCYIINKRLLREPVLLTFVYVHMLCFIDVFVDHTLLFHATYKFVDL